MIRPTHPRMPKTFRTVCIDKTESPVHSLCELSTNEGGGLVWSGSDLRLGHISQPITVHWVLYRDLCSKLLTPWPPSKTTELDWHSKCSLSSFTIIYSSMSSVSRPHSSYSTPYVSILHPPGCIHNIYTMHSGGSINTQWWVHHPGWPPSQITHYTQQQLGCPVTTPLIAVSSSLPSPTELPLAS